MNNPQMKNNRNEKIGFKLQIIKIAKNCGMQLKQCLMEYLWPLMYILAKNQEARKKERLVKFRQKRGNKSPKVNEISKYKTNINQSGFYEKLNKIDKYLGVIKKKCPVSRRKMASDTITDLTDIKKKIL